MDHGVHSDEINGQAVVIDSTRTGIRKRILSAFNAGNRIREIFRVSSKVAYQKIAIFGTCRIGQQHCRWGGV